MTRVYLSQAMEKIEAAAKKVIAAVAEGDMLRTHWRYCDDWRNMSRSM